MSNRREGESEHFPCISQNQSEVVMKPVVLPKIDPETQEDLDADGLEKLQLWVAFSEHYISSSVLMVEFCKRLPGFLGLDSDEQIIIIKYSSFMVWVLQVANICSEDAIAFQDRVYMTRKQLEKLFDRTFVKSLMNITQTIRDLALNPDQMSLFAAILIMNPDRPINCASFVKATRKHIEGVLKTLMEKSYCSNTKVFDDLMALIPELENVRIKMAAHAEWFRERNRSVLHIDELFKELFSFDQHDT